MTNEEKMNKIFDETNEFFKKKVREAFGLGEQAKIVDICDESITDIYDVLEDCCYEEESEVCKYCASRGICKTLEEVDYYEWNRLEYKGPVGYVGETETTTAISNNGISW